MEYKWGRRTILAGDVRRDHAKQLRVHSHRQRVLSSRIGTASRGSSIEIGSLSASLAFSHNDLDNDPIERRNVDAYDCDGNTNSDFQIVDMA